MWEAIKLLVDIATNLGRIRRYLAENPRPARGVDKEKLYQQASDMASIVSATLDWSRRRIADNESHLEYVLATIQGARRGLRPIRKAIAEDAETLGRVSGESPAGVFAREVERLFLNMREQDTMSSGYTPSLLGDAEELLEDVLNGTRNATEVSQRILLARNTLLRNMKAMREAYQALPREP